MNDILKPRSHEQFHLQKEYRSVHKNLGLLICHTGVLQNDTDNPEDYIRRVLQSVIDRSQKTDTVMFQMLIEADGMEMPILIPEAKRPEHCRGNIQQDRKSRTKPDQSQSDVLPH
uniref:Uncharacterized protein n=1 Tax=Ditylenchus dipsaci TaxID=166011 RepID=A0A915E971_9BILA